MSEQEPQRQPGVHVGSGATAGQGELFDGVDLGLPPPPETEVTEDAILGFNTPVARESGVPGGGGIMTAAELALFYQALMHNPPTANGDPIWKPEVLKEALRVRSGDYFDPIFEYKCNRALGVIVAGDDGFAIRPLWLQPWAIYTNDKIGWYSCLAARRCKRHLGL